MEQNDIVSRCADMITKEMSETINKETLKMCQELQKENEELKEKNDGFKALLLCECGVSIERVVEIKEENKKLKKEIKHLEERAVNDYNTRMNREKELQEHLDKSREVSNKLIAENNTTMPSQSALYRENKKLKELNTTLQYQYDMAIQIDNKEIAELKEHLECEEDGYPCSTWFSEKLDFHIKYHFCNEGGEYYETLKDLQEKPNCLDDLIYGSLERIREDNKKLKKFKTDVADALHFDDDLEDEDYIDGVKELENDVACFVIKDEEPSLNELKLLLKTKEQEKTIARLTKERNYLGDYQGGATSEEEEDE